MRKIISTAGLAIAIAAGSFMAAPAAFAQSMQLEISPDGVRPVIRDRDPYGDNYGRRGQCSPREARQAAREEGLRDVEIVRVTSRSVTVEGETRRGDVERIRFANVRGCPEL